MEKRTMDIILILLGVIVLLFIISMIVIYLVTGGVPDSVVYSFFTAVTGECGFMGWIKTSKTKNREREWELEDREMQVEEEQKKINEQKEILKAQEEAIKNDRN